MHATDKDTGLFGSIQYTDITGRGSDAFAIDTDTGLITVAMGSSLDREMAAQLQLIVNARDENGKGNTGVVPLIVNLLDVNDNAPIFEKDVYVFTLNSDLTNFSTAAIIKVNLNIFYIFILIELISLRNWRFSINIINISLKKTRPLTPMPNRRTMRFVTN